MYWSLQFRDETVETEESVESRAKAFMMKLAQEIAVEGKDEMKVLVTSHGLLIRSILIHLHKTAGKKTNFPPIDSWFYQVSPNTGMTEAEDQSQQINPGDKWGDFGKPLSDLNMEKTETKVVLLIT